LQVPRIFNTFGHVEFVRLGPGFEMGNWLSSIRQPPGPDPSIDPYENNQYPNMGKYQDISKYKTGKDFRLEFDNSLVANGYPSTGGYLTRRVTGVEIEWLVLDKMHEIQMSKEQAEEDNFCLRLRRLGAKWWENPDEEFSVENDIKNYPDGEIEIETGWSNDGDGSSSD